MVKNGIKDIDDGSAVEGTLPREHLVEQAARCKNVRRRTHQAALCLLRRHVLRRADDQTLRGNRRESLALNRRRQMRAGTRKAKVQQLDTVRSQENIRRFQIPVHNPQRVQCVQGLKHLLLDTDRLGRGHRPRNEAIRERLAFQELQHQKEVAALFEHIVDLADPGMADTRQRSGFAPKSILGVFALRRAAERLDRNMASQA